jgi:Sec-independent protein translocase protein TatA
MNIFKVLFQVFILYMLYKLVFDFIIPVYRASKRMKNQVGEMQQKMQEQYRQQQAAQERAQTTAANSPLSKNEGRVDKDYIDYEELT